MKTKPYRVLVTGSRAWDDPARIYRELGSIARQVGHGRIVVVHGDAQGADRIAAVWAGTWPVKEERHPADWVRYGKSAGYRRNAEMVALGADVCLAFIKDGSRGATHCAGLAEKAGIPVQRYTADCRKRKD